MCRRTGKRVQEGVQAQRDPPGAVRPLTFLSAPLPGPFPVLSRDGDPSLGEKVPAAHRVARGW